MSSSLSGILITALSGVAVTAEMVFSMAMQRASWPYWRITGFSCVASSLFLFSCVCATGTPFPAKGQWKWVGLESFFGCVYWCASLMAVQIGTNPGDVASLTSINIVVAAILGRLILSEDFRFVHSFAIALSLGGAVLITQPPFIFGGESTSSGLGYFCAISAGFLQGCFFISTRKAADVSGWFMSALIMGVSAPFCWAVPLVPGFSDSTLEVMGTDPAMAIFFLAVAFATNIFSASTCCVGSAMCPAAVSATVYTSSSMICGYLASAVLFAQAPSAMSLCGSTLMLAGVVVVAIAGAQRSEAQAPSELEFTGGIVPGAGVIAQPPEISTGELEETESFGSFVAAEFSEFSPSSGLSVRFRRPVRTSEPAAASVRPAAFRVSAGSVLGKAVVSAAAAVPATSA